MEQLTVVGGRWSTKEFADGLQRSGVQEVESAGVQLVRFLYCDNGGIIRGKATPSRGWQVA